MPGALLTSTFLILRECGRARTECVVFWTGPLESPGVVDGQDHPAHRLSPGGYKVDSRWLTPYWFQLARERRAIRAQLHTHPGAAFHSTTDDRWPVVSLPGFMSIVIPDFAIGPVSLEGTCVALLDRDGGWSAVAAETAIKLTP